MHIKLHIVMEQGHDNHWIISVRSFLMNPLVLWNLNILQIIFGGGATVVKIFILE